MLILYIEDVPVEISILVVDYFMLSLVLGLLEISELILLLLLISFIILDLMFSQKLPNNLFEPLELNILQF